MTTKMAKRENNAAAIPEFDPRTFVSTISREEKDRLDREGHEQLMRGETDQAFRTIGRIPLLPNVAMGILRDPSLGREHLLADGYFNLSDAEAFYGKDWLEKYG